MNERTAIINYIFEKYNFQSYLEIGVYRPDGNFDHINAKLKHSVDNLENSAHLYTHWMSSDDFFAYAIGSQMYDVIFIDGLHEYEQCYRDVSNALDHLNPGGFIFIHDVNPLEKVHTVSYWEFLHDACPTHWNGSVYKAFIQLKYELPDWSVFSVEDINGGVGVLTKRSLYKNIQMPEIPEYYFKWENYYDNMNAILHMHTFEEYKKLINQETLEDLS